MPFPHARPGLAPILLPKCLLPAATAPYPPTPLLAALSPSSLALPALSAARSSQSVGTALLTMKSRRTPESPNLDCKRQETPSSREPGAEAGPGRELPLSIPHFRPAEGAFLKDPLSSSTWAAFFPTCLAGIGCISSLLGRALVALLNAPLFQLPERRKRLREVVIPGWRSSPELSLAGTGELFPDGARRKNTPGQDGGGVSIAAPGPAELRVIGLRRQ